MKSLCAAIVRRRLWVLVLVVLVTGILGSQIRNLRIVIDPVAILPKSHPNVIGTNLAEAIFGSKYLVVVGVSAADGGTALRPEVLETVAHLTRSLSNVAGVKRHTMMSVTAEKARSITGSQGEMQVEPLLSTPINAASIDRLKAHLRDNPMYQDLLVSRDGSMATVSFSVEIGSRGFREVVDRVVAVMDAHRGPAVKLNATGTPVYFATVERFSQRMAFLFPIALLIIGLIHFEAFRTVQGMLLPLVTAVLAVVWALGIMGLLHIPMDAFNATTPILVLAVAAGHAVQILKRYYEEYDRLNHERDSANPVTVAAGALAEKASQARENRALNDQAIIESLSRIAPVMLTAGLVAAAGFFSLLSFEIVTVRTFGVITGLGILCALLLELTLIPALRSLLKPPPAKALVSSGLGDTGTRFWDRFAAALSRWVLRDRKRIVIGFAAIAAVSASGLFFINQENSTKSYFGEDVPIRVEDRFMNQKLPGTNTLYVVFQGDRADRMKDPALLQLVEQTQRYIETLPDVGKTASMVDALKQMNRAMNDGKPEQHRLPDSQALISQYLLLYSISGQPTDFDAYVDYEYRNLNLVVWMKNDSSRYAADMVSRIRQFIGPKLPEGVTIQIGGSVPQTSALSETLVHGKLLNIAQMIAVVFVAGVIVFRSMLAALYLILPLLVTVLVNFGIMGLAGIPLNTPNSVSSAMGIGIGADYAIYMLYRLREELQRDGDFEAALQRTIRTAGKAVLYVATAVAGGYSVLMLSFGFYVHIWFGILIVLSMIVSAVTALLLIPALLTMRLPECIRKPRAGTHWLPRESGALPAWLAVASTALLLGVLGTVAGPARADTPSAAEIMERSYLATRLDSSSSNATFKLTAASGQERIRKTFGATKLAADGVANRRVIRFLSPGDVRNTTSLLVENSRGDDEIWVYLPALKKARRLASSNKKGSFFGTDLSYGDVVGHKPPDWTHRLLKDDSVDGEACFVVESLPAKSDIAEESGYSKRVSWVSKRNLLPLRVDSFDAAGAALKTIVNSHYKTVDAKAGKWQAMQVQAKNLQTGHQTRIDFDRFEANVQLAEDLFTQRYLEREE